MQTSLKQVWYCITSKKQQKAKNNRPLSFYGLSVMLIFGPNSLSIVSLTIFCSTGGTLLKGRFIGFSDVPQHGKILSKHWKKNRKQWIENQYLKNWSDRVVFETEGKKNLEVKASEPRNDKWLKDSPPFYNAISRQSISTVSCKGSANIRGKITSYNKKIENMHAIPINYLCS